MPEQDTAADVDLRIDAFEYARQYRELLRLGERIKAAAKKTGLNKIVFYDGLEHFQLEEGVLSSDAPLKLRLMACIDQRAPLE